MGLIFNMKSVYKIVIFNIFFIFITWLFSFVGGDKFIHHYMLANSLFSIFFYIIVMTEAYPVSFQEFLKGNGVAIKPMKRDLLKSFLIYNFALIAFESTLAVNYHVYYFILRSAILLPILFSLLYCVPMMVVIVPYVLYLLLTMNVGYATWNGVLILFSVSSVLLTIYYAKRHEYRDYAFGQVKKSS